VCRRGNGRPRVAGVCVLVVLKRDFEAAAIDLSRCLARNVLRFSARQWWPHRCGLMGTTPARPLLQNRCMAHCQARHP
jgi:hypothetical protein